MKKKTVGLALGLLALAAAATGCGQKAGSETAAGSENAAGSAAESTAAAGTGAANIDTTGFLQLAGDTQLNTVDPEQTTEFFAVPLNIFDRLVEVETDADGNSKLVPSLADDWDISPDGLTYTFTLHPDVKYTNGNALTSADVLYTFNRLLSYSKSKNADFVDQIKGAEELMAGSIDTLEGTGFETIDDLNFKVTLKEPYAAFLACLSTPQVSILDSEATEAAGDDFGLVPEKTIGTGAFKLESWIPGSDYILTRNDEYWGGASELPGIWFKSVKDADTQRMMFEKGELDILDLDNSVSQMEYFVNSPDYKDQIVSGNRLGIYYYSINEGLEPFSDVRVRKALQMAVDRQAILDALYMGKGHVENGIVPTGAIGHNADLPEIKYDPEGAKALLAEAGYPNGFDMEIAESTAASDTSKQLDQIMQSMFQEIGINCQIKQYDDATFYDVRSTGELPMYGTSWSADFNDPDNFIYTFFGTEANAKNRSFNYYDTDAIARVAAARSIVNEDERLKEYNALEEKIVQEDAAWIPLFSKEHLFVVNPQVKGFKVSWNGWTDNQYHDVSKAQ